MACVYRAPTSPLGPLLERLQVFMDTYSEGATVPGIYVLGDFNPPDTDWKTCTSKDAQGTTLLEFTARYFLTQTVSKPTREENILDLVLTNREDYIVETGIEDWGISDHSTVHCTLAFGVSCRVPSSHCESEPTGFSALDVHGSNFESLRAELCSVNWEDIAIHCHEHDCSDLVSKITEKVLEITEKHCKRKRGGVTKRADPMLKRLKKKQRNLNRKIRRAKREQAFKE